MRAWGRYFKMDLSRLFRSPQFYIASAGVFAVFMASSGQAVGIANVFDLYYILKIYSTTIVVYACSNFAYANSLLEDWEHGFFRVAVLRGNLKSYVCAKACCCFIAALLSVMAGILAFVSAESTRMPLMMDTDASMLPKIRDYHIDMFGFLLYKDRILLYFACSSMMIGILGGALALFAMWLSLVAKNRMFAVCIPVAGYYFLVNHWDQDTFSFNGMYFYSGNALSNPALSFLLGVAVAAALSACFTALIYQRMKQMASGIRQ